MTDFTPYELELLQGALKEKREGFYRYIDWIDDRPQLPDRSIAIANVKAECKAILSLEVKISQERQK